MLGTSQIYTSSVEPECPAGAGSVFEESELEGKIETLIFILLSVGCKVTVGFFIAELVASGRNIMFFSSPYL
jgi:hypothetical protein